MTADKKAVTDYIPITTNVINGLDLVKSSMIDTHKEEESNFHVPLTPSPSDPSETESYGEITISSEKTVIEDSTLYYPPPYSTTSPYITSQLAPGYYTPPTPFPTPTTSQAFQFDPLYIPQLYSYPSIIPPSPYITHPDNAYPTKRRKLSRSAKKHGAGDEEVCRVNMYANSVAVMKSTLMDYHNAASVEIFKGGTESVTKNKMCQTTFRQPHQMSSLEDFTSLAILIQIFSKQASMDAGKRYGVKTSGSGG